MVERAMPGWSWEEDFDVEQRAQLAARIVAELDARLGSNAEPTSYVALGYPRLSPNLRSALHEVIREEPDLHEIARQEQSPAYVTSDPSCFSRLLPVLFEFGPPEISLLALRPDSEKDDPDRTIIKLMSQLGQAHVGAVRMDFDSGDLVQIT